MTEYLKIESIYMRGIVSSNTIGSHEESLTAKVYLCTTQTTARKLFTQKKLLTYSDEEKGNYISGKRLKDFYREYEKFIEEFLLTSKEIIIVDYGVKGIPVDLISDIRAAQRIKG